MKKRTLAMLLVAIMVLTLAPVSAFSADTFNDVPDGYWGKDSIERWAGYGVLNGMGDGSFNPDASMKRCEFAKMLCELMGYTEKAPNTFDDVSEDDWFADAILKLVAAGVMNGVGDGKADPEGTVTREQAAVMLCRAFKIDTTKTVDSSFNDAGQIADWAAGSVAALSAKGMINGVGDNTFAPKLEINRASVAKLADNMVGEYVTESKTITGEVKGFVVVKAENAEVKFENAKVAETIMVSPASTSANVALTGETTANAVVISAPEAKVDVEKTAAVTENVTVEAPKAEVSVSGTAGKIEVAQDVKDTKVAVNEGAEVKDLDLKGTDVNAEISGKVDTITASGENAKVNVSGTVNNVVIAEGANNTSLTANSGAKVENVTSSADNVKVSGSGNVGNVTANKGSVDVTTPNTNVKNEGADKVTADNKDVAKDEDVTTPPASSGSGGSGGSITGPSVDPDNPSPSVAPSDPGTTEEDPDPSTSPSTQPGNEEEEEEDPDPSTSPSTQPGAEEEEEEEDPNPPSGSPSTQPGTAEEQEEEEEEPNEEAPIPTKAVGE